MRSELDRSSNVQGAAVIVALVAVVLLIFAPVGNYEFISLDDPQYVSANPMVLGGLTWSGIRYAFRLSGGFYWHPLTWMSHMIDVQIFGVDPGAFHSVNVAIHALNSVLLFVALRRLTGAPIRSGFVAALFAVHPLHVESVAWISERKDVLSTAFWMASLVAYAGYVRDPRIGRRLLLVLLFAGGLLAKPMILTLPFVLLLLDYWPLRRLDPHSPERGRVIWQLIREKAMLFALAFASVVITLVSNKESGGVVSTERLPIAERVGNALISYALYLRDMVWPTRLAAFYPFSAPQSPAVAVSAVGLAMITVAAVRLARSRPYIAVGWLWYVGVLMPVIGLLQAGDQGRADRFTYVPLVGIFVALVWAVGDIAERFPGSSAALATTGLFVVSALSVASRAQLSYWKDDLAVWRRAVSVTNNNYRAENHYGVALTDRGMTAEGIKHYVAALKIWPNYPEAHNNLGTARVDEGNIDEAIQEFSEAVRQRPRTAMFHYNLAVVLNTKGRNTEAIAEMRTALKLDPGNAQYTNGLAVLTSTKQQ